MYGEMHPCAGCDPIPLLKPSIVVGRRENCDVVLRFSNISGAHCELTLIDGFWFVKDLSSSNGVKVNGLRVIEQRVDPGDTLSVGKHDYQMMYDPSQLGSMLGPGGAIEPKPDMFSRSLLDRAGLESKHTKKDSR